MVPGPKAICDQADLISGDQVFWKVAYLPIHLILYLVRSLQVVWKAASLPRHLVLHGHCTVSPKAVEFIGRLLSSAI